MPAHNSIIPGAAISQRIFFVRGIGVILGVDLVRFDGVQTKNLNKAVKRNASRFPSDFRFQLSSKEMQTLRFQTGTSECEHRGRRYTPYSFTEPGMAMLSSLLRSSRAVQVSVAIMRAFVRLGETITTDEELRRKIDALEKRYDAGFQAIFEALRQLSETPIPTKKPIGFHTRFEFPSKSAKPAKATPNNTK